MRSPYSRTSIPTSGGVSRGNGLDDIRINPLLVQRTVPQSNAEQARSSALSRVYAVGARVEEPQRREERGEDSEAGRTRMGHHLVKYSGRWNWFFSALFAPLRFIGACFKCMVTAQKLCSPPLEPHRSHGERAKYCSFSRFFVGFRPRAALYDMK